MPFNNPKARAAFFANKNKKPGDVAPPEKAPGGLLPGLSALQNNTKIENVSPAQDYLNKPQKPIKFAKLRSMMGPKLPKV